MKATGVVRKISDLGCGIREGDPLDTSLTPFDSFC